MKTIGEQKQYTKIWTRNNTIYDTYVPHEKVYDNNGILVKETWRRTHFYTYFGDLTKRYFRPYVFKEINHKTGAVKNYGTAPLGKYTTKIINKGSYTDVKYKQAYDSEHKRITRGVLLKQKEARAKVPTTFAFNKAVKKKPLKPVTTASYKLGTEGSMKNLSDLASTKKYSLTSVVGKSLKSPPKNITRNTNVFPTRKMPSQAIEGSIFSFKQTNTKKKKKSPGASSSMVSRSKPTAGVKYSFK